MAETLNAIRPGWRTALNPPIYLVSILPGLGVPLLAGTRPVLGMALAIATLAVVLLQHAINLFNDAADWRLGADSEKYDSWVRVHADRPRLAVVHGAISLLAGGALGLGVLWSGRQWWLLVIALPLVGLGYLYNAGPRPLSYTHLGEWVTGICYGGVFACLWLVAGQPPGLRMAAGGIAFAALAVALLLSHQPPQIETDRRAGKLSFAVRFGAARTRLVARLGFALFAAALVAAIFIAQSPLVGIPVAGCAVLLFWRIGRDTIDPRRILLSASLLLAVAHAARALAAW